MSVTLEQALTIAKTSLAKGRELDLKPLSVVVLDERASIVTCQSEDGVSKMRWQIAHGKANAAIAMGLGTRALMTRAEQQAYFIQAMNGLADRLHDGAELVEHRGSFHSHYERTKFLQEEAAFSWSGSVEVVCVNPSSVQGPGRATGTGALLLRAIEGRLPALPNVPISIVDIDDCARGHLLAAERDVVLRYFGMPLCVLGEAWEDSNDLHWNPRTNVERAFVDGGKTGLEDTWNYTPERMRYYPPK